jgi:hypothetical protein
MPDDPRDRAILEAVQAALKALADLTIEDKLIAVELIDYWVQVELASWERAEAGDRVH